MSKPREYKTLAHSDIEKLKNEGTHDEIKEGIDQILYYVLESINRYWNPLPGQLSGNPQANLLSAIELLNELRGGVPEPVKLKGPLPKNPPPRNLEPIEPKTMRRDRV